MPYTVQGGDGEGTNVVFRQVIDAFEALDSATVDGERVAALIRDCGVDDVAVERVSGERGHTDFVKVLVPGTRGRPPAATRRPSGSSAGSGGSAPGRSGSASSPTATARSPRSRSR